LKELREAMKIMEQHNAKMNRLPIKVKINKKWMEEQTAKNEVIVDGKVHKDFYTLMGIPIEIDNDVSEFEWVYRDEFHEAIDKVIDNLYRSFMLPPEYFK
jgi:NADH:ubiquinone oxidoreductase subunit D